ncbi:hypothetical protein D3C85_1568090 [compost metagenome]
MGFEDSPSQRDVVDYRHTHLLGIRSNSQCALVGFHQRDKRQQGYFRAEIHADGDVGRVGDDHPRAAHVGFDLLGQKLPVQVATAALDIRVAVLLLVFTLDGVLVHHLIFHE